MNVKDLWLQIKKNKQAIPSFNFTTSDVALAAARIAKKYNYYCLLSTSERELKFTTMEVVVGIVKGLKEQGFPVFLNLDHGKDVELIKKAIKIGYDCIHFDGSNLPLAENIRITKEIVALCQPLNISVEGEVGKVGGTSTLNSNLANESTLTNINEAVEFVKSAGVDLLACSFGSFHGISSDKTKTLDLTILEEIKKQADVPFVLHGGSTIERVELKKAIEAGVIKINFNTELRLAWSEGLKEYQKQKPEDIVPANELTFADQKVETVMEEKIKTCINNFQFSNTNLQ